MSSLPYRAYKAATMLLQPAAGPYLSRRVRIGKEDCARLGERLGIASRGRPPGTLVWVHGASIGEALAVLPLVERLCARGLGVLVTTGTVTSAEILRRRLPAGALHQFVPLDTPRFARRFLSAWRPDCALFAESELWPNLLFETARQQVPLALVNARLSPRSFARWRRLPRFIGDLLGCTALCLAQSPGDAERLRALGAPHVVTAGNLKYDAAPAPVDAAALDVLRAAIGGRPVWLAASTHPAEEEAVLAAHRRLAARRPGLLTIVAPRHPGRGPLLEAAAAAAGMGAARRSRGALPGQATALFVADTVGELGLLFRLGRVVFMGKSLAGGGGQNPIEPARLGCAVLHGPLVGNFEDVYAALDAGGGACSVPDAAGLAAAADALLADPGRALARGQAALATVEREAGATDRTLAALAPLLTRAS